MTRKPSSRSRQDDLWMARALVLARRGEALASPNPMVGAVLVDRDGQVLGEGFHVYDKLRHAEVVALEAAGAAARGATLYVTLEPCSHTGRTLPCVRAIIASGVRRVVAAMVDPHPAVAGRGLAALRAAGIAVEIGERSDEARRLNEGFARRVLTGLPFVTLKSALTQDGRLTLSRARGAQRGARPHPQPRPQPRWISSPASRAAVQLMRHASDALLTGIGTVLADNPLLTDRSGLPRRRPLLRVVLDSRLRLPLRSKLVRSAASDLLVFTAAAESSPRAQALRRAGVEVVNLAERAGKKPPRRGAKSARINLRAVLAELGRRGINSVLLEAGKKLNDAMLAAGLVDKFRLFIAPAKGSASIGFGFFSRADPLKRCGILRGRRAPGGLAFASSGGDLSVEGYLRDVYGLASED